MKERIAGAIDIGGTNIRVGLVSECGQVLVGASMPTLTGAGSAPRCVQAICQELGRQCMEISIDIKSLSGVGVVCAGPIDCACGVIDNPYTLPGWENFNIIEHLQERTGLPVRLEHDVNGALLGEVFLNRWHGKRVLMISFGTGIGVAVFDHDRPFQTGTKYQPEMGHIVVDCSATNECYCRHSGCFESLWSGTALESMAERLGYDSFDTMFALWQKGEAALEPVMQGLCRRLCSGVWNLMIIFKPDILVLGGGVMRTYYSFCREILQNDLANMGDFVENHEICSARHDDGSSIVGASRLIFMDCQL